MSSHFSMKNSDNDFKSLLFAVVNSQLRSSANNTQSTRGCKRLRNEAVDWTQSFSNKRCKLDAKYSNTECNFWREKEQMYLPIIPPPEYFDELVRSQIQRGILQIDKFKIQKRKLNSDEFDNQMGFIREPYELRSQQKKTHELFDQKENKNTTTIRKRRFKSKLPLSDSMNHISPVKEMRSPIERIDYGLLGPLHNNREYRCSRCPKCKRASLEDISYQRGQCGYQSCAFEYCILCHAKYHPCYPCLNWNVQKSAQSIPSGRLRRC
ncbi:hypothetical protein ACOME3_007226 [Neoechinorhynchus agilis]